MWMIETIHNDLYISSRSYGWKIIGFEGHFLIHHVVANWMIFVNRQIRTSLYHLINGQMISKSHDFSFTTCWDHVNHIEQCGASIHAWELSVAHISLYEVKNLSSYPLHTHTSSNKKDKLLNITILPLTLILHLISRIIMMWVHDFNSSQLYSLFYIMHYIIQTKS